MRILYKLLMDKYYQKIDNNWVHKAPIKVLLNPILRKIQFWRDDPYVIASVTEWKKKQPRFVKFKFCRVQYRGFKDTKDSL